MLNKSSRFYWIIGVLSCLLSSCIATKKVVYLEGDSKEKTTLKTTDWVYKVQVGDRFYIKITDPMAEISLGQGSEITQQTNQNENVLQQMPSVRDFVVQEDGTLNVPIIGKIEAKDKTIQEINAAIFAACKGYYSQPLVKVFMTNYNVTVLGEVNAPGLYQLITQRPDFFDAIGMAGDMTDFARRNSVKLIRKNKEEVIIEYLDITDPNFVSSPYFYIQPNDVIHVMPLKVKKYSSDNATPIFLSIATTILALISILR